MIVTLDMSKEHLQNKTVQVALKVRNVLIGKVDGLVANNLESNWLVVHAIFTKNFYSAHESGARRLVFVKQVSS